MKWVKIEIFYIARKHIADQCDVIAAVANGA